MKFFENGMMSRLFTNVDVGIDLGTANLRLYLKGRGVVFDEPSVVAVDRSSGKVVAVGRRAHEMLGKTPDHIEVVHPLRGGVVADYEACQGMLNTVLTRIVGRNLFFKPRVMVCIPTEITSVERRAVLEACTQAGAAKTLLIEAPLAAAIGAGMLFVVIRDYWRYFLIGGGVAAAGGAWIYHVMHSDSDLGFRSQRILVWLDPEKYADGKGFQVLQGLYGIGSGGIFGKGLGNSMQKLGYIPEAQNDMIFSIICEELGVFGAASIIALFLILCWRLLIIANNAEDLFGGLVTVGVLLQIAVQVILNIAVVTNTIPNTGVSLPFISYGGSSVIILLAEIGITMSVARNIRLRELK